jgi:hypothetical protein
VQSARASDLSSSPLGISLTNVGAGHQLVLVVHMEGSPQPSVTGVTDSSGCDWSLISATHNGGYNFQDSEIWWCQSSPGGTTTVSVKFGGKSYGYGFASTTRQTPLGFGTPSRRP